MKKLLILTLLIALGFVFVSTENREEILNKTKSAVNEIANEVDEKVVNFHSDCKFNTEPSQVTMVAFHRVTKSYELAWMGESLLKGSKKKPTFDLNINDGVHAYAVGNFKENRKKNWDLYEVCRKAI